MTAYVANHEKKLRIFAKRERELLHAIKHDAPAEKLSVAAERLRAAKINVYKCRFTKNCENQPHNFSPEEYAENNNELQRWLSMTTDDIVKSYRPRV
jgi:hypothetical protein